jgi:hypothetical protein
MLPVYVLLLVLTLNAAADNPLAPPFKVFDQAVITHMERAEIYDGIAHYQFLATVGPGEYDKIKIHRVVREPQAGKPNPDGEAVMMITGQPNTFAMLFLAPLISSVPERGRALPIYLARHGMDVWGMDYGHALVPFGTTDFTFFKDWGVSKDAQHVRLAMQFARLTRWMGGQGPAPLFLAGLSSGARVAYDVAAEEAHRPPFLRNVKGLVVLDMAVFYQDAALRADYCARAATSQARLDSGIYHQTSGVNLKRIGTLAVTDPAGVSPFFPGLNNYQGGLRSGAVGSAPLYWHFVGADFAAPNVPSQLRYTEDRLWFDAIQAVPPYTPLLVSLDIQLSACKEIVSEAHNPYRHIRVPVFYVGAHGGFGMAGEYTVRLTRSRDVKILNIQMLPDEDRAMDYGHVDLVYSSTAESLVWTPILDWIKAHR